MTIHCPNCGTPISPAQIAREIAQHPRPSAKGQVRNPWGAKGKPKTQEETK